MRVPTKITISLPRAMASQVEALHKAEHRTRSGLLQEAPRAYFRILSPEARPASASGKAVDQQARRASSTTVAVEARRTREHERMARRLLEQSRLSQSLLELRNAMVRKRPAAGAFAVQPHSFGVKPGLALYRINQWADELEAQEAARKLRSSSPPTSSR